MSKRYRDSEGNWKGVYTKLDQTTYDMLQEGAKTLHVSMSAIVNDAIVSYLSQTYTSPSPVQAVGQSLDNYAQNRTLLRANYDDVIATLSGKEEPTCADITTADAAAPAGTAGTSRSGRSVRSTSKRNPK